MKRYFSGILGSLLFLLIFNIFGIILLITNMFEFFETKNKEPTSSVQIEWLKGQVCKVIETFKK
jgi:hypothetical protein